MVAGWEVAWQLDKMKVGFQIQADFYLDVSEVWIWRTSKLFCKSFEWFNDFFLNDNENFYVANSFQKDKKTNIWQNFYHFVSGNWW